MGCKFHANFRPAISSGQGRPGFAIPAKSPPGRRKAPIIEPYKSPIMGACSILVILGRSHPRSVRKTQAPRFHPGRQSVWPAAEGSQTLCRGQLTAPSFFVSRDIPRPFSASERSPLSPGRSAGHSGRACCPEIGSPPRQTIVFRFYHNFRKNTNPNPSPCRNAGSVQAFSHRAPHKRPSENPGRFERGSILAQSSLGLIHSFSARPCIILTAA